MLQFLLISTENSISVFTRFPQLDPECCYTVSCDWLSRLSIK